MMDYELRQIDKLLELEKEYRTTKEILGEINYTKGKEINERRLEIISTKLKPLLKEFFLESVNLKEFKTRNDSLNKKNNLWGFTGMIGQMFFNQLVSYPFVFENVNYTVEGNNYVKSYVDYYLNGDKYESISKRNWKTGWLTYSHSKTTNNTHTIQEQELTSSVPSITGFEITTIFVGLTIIAIVMSRKRKQTKK